MELSFLSALAQEAAASGTPAWGQFELTPVCNLKCRMCYVHKPEEDHRSSGRILPASFWLDAARQAVQQGMLVLSLTGGETLLYPHLDELMEGLSGLGLMISFNTNGTLIDEKRVEWFRRFPPTKINITLYGASDETYRALCGAEHGFTRVKRGIELLQRAGFNVYLNAVLVPENQQELPQMHRFAAEHGLMLNTASYIFPARGCAGCPAEEIHRLSPENAAQLRCMDMIITSGRQAFRQSAANTAWQLMQMEQAKDWQPSFRPCRAGVCSFAINWEGMLQPCVMFNEIRIPMQQKDFASGWQELRQRMAAVPVPEKCTGCRHQMVCPVCKAAVYQETATHTAAPDYLCTYTDWLTEILKMEGSGIAVRISDSGDFRAGGCSE